MSKLCLCVKKKKNRVPENNLPYLHKRPQIRALLLSALCISISVVWMVFRNEDQWVWSQQQHKMFDKTGEHQAASAFMQNMNNLEVVEATCAVEPSDSVLSRWAWVLQDALGIAFCLYMLKTVRLPTFKVWKNVRIWTIIREVVGSHTYLISFSPAGLHFTTVGAVRLRCFLRIHHTLLHKGRSNLSWNRKHTKL